MNKEFVAELEALASIVDLKESLLDVKYASALNLCLLIDCELKSLRDGVHPFVHGLSRIEMENVRRMVLLRSKQALDIVSALREEMDKLQVRKAFIGERVASAKGDWLRRQQEGDVFDLVDRSAALFAQSQK